MRYITTGEIDPNADYLLIGYKNRYGQLDVAKLKVSLLSSYFISNNKLTALEKAKKDLSGYLSSLLTKLSSNSNGGGDRMTAMELSAYCSRNHFNEMLDERTFNIVSNFTNYLKKNFRTENAVSADTALSYAGAPLTVALGKVELMFNNAIKTKPAKKE